MLSIINTRTIIVIVTTLRVIFFTGVALLGATSDINEASSLTFENDIVDIYSNSWGPFDDGARVEGPGELTRLALQPGTDNVRILQLFTIDGVFLGT